MRNIVTKRSWLAALVALMAVALAAPAWAETYLWANQITFSRLVDGKSFYEGSGFDHLYLDVEDEDTVATDAHVSATGSMTIVGGSYTFWNGTADEAVSGTIKSFPVKAIMSAGDDYLEYQPINDAGDLIEEFYGAAETGLNGREVRWEFPAMPELDGKATVPNFRSTAEQLKNYVPYVELVRSGGNVTGVKYRVVHPSDTSKALALPTASLVQVRVYDHDPKRRYSSRWQRSDANTTPEGTLDFDTPIPEADVCYVDVRLLPDRSVDACYTWRFPVSTTNDDSGIASWGELATTPLKIVKGETETITVSLKDDYRLSTRPTKLFVGDASVLDASATGAGTTTATLSLRGANYGKTTVRLFYYDVNYDYHYASSVAREVWVTDENGEIPSGGGGETSTGGGGGGCSSAGFGALSLAIVGAALIARKRQ